MSQARTPAALSQPSKAPIVPATKTAPIPLDANLLRQVSGGVCAPHGTW